MSTRFKPGDRVEFIKSIGTDRCLWGQQGTVLSASDEIELALDNPVGKHDLEGCCKTNHGIYTHSHNLKLIDDPDKSIHADGAKPDIADEEDWKGSPQIYPNETKDGSPKFKPGDEVSVVSDVGLKLNVVGKIGRIVSTYNTSLPLGYISVAFNENVGGHSLGGACKDGHGFYIHKDNMVLRRRETPKSNVSHSLDPGDSADRPSKPSKILDIPDLLKKKPSIKLEQNK